MMMRLAMVVSLLIWAGHASGQGVVVAPGLWDRPRSASVVLADAAVKQTVNAYLAQAGGRLVIHHGAAQDSVLQAEELRSWLIALAVESRHIGLLRDLKPGEALRMEVIP